jgi:mRNA interferase RelE/StbE
MFDIEIRRRAEKELDDVPFRYRQRIVVAIQTLADNPRPSGCVKLMDDIYRIRVGPWRVIYMIHEKGRWIDIGKIARRHEATYKGIEARFQS